jgi:hypothetical protein
LDVSFRPIRLHERLIRCFVRKDREGFMSAKDKAAVSRSSILVYVLAAGAIGGTGFLIWRSVARESDQPPASVTQSSNFADEPNTALDRLMSQHNAAKDATAKSASDDGPTTGPAAPATQPVTALAAPVAAKPGEIVFVASGGGVRRTMTKPSEEPPFASRNSSKVERDPAATSTRTRAATTKPSGPRIYKPDDPPIRDTNPDGSPKYYDYDRAAAQHVQPKYYNFDTKSRQ